MITITFLLFWKALGIVVHVFYILVFGFTSSMHFYCVLPPMCVIICVFSIFWHLVSHHPCIFTVSYHPCALLFVCVLIFLIFSFPSSMHCYCVLPPMCVLICVCFLFFGFGFPSSMHFYFVLPPMCVLICVCFIFVGFGFPSSMHFYCVLPPMYILIYVCF